MGSGRKKFGNRNVIGKKILAYRAVNDIRQKDFLAHLQVRGLDISSASLARIEGQDRFVLDHELIIIAQAMKVTPNDLLDWKKHDYSFYY